MSSEEDIDFPEDSSQFSFGSPSDTEENFRHESRSLDTEESHRSPSPPAKRRKTGTLDLSDVPINLLPIPSDKEGSSSRFKRVTKKADKWQAQIRSAEGGRTGTLDLSDVPMNLPPIPSDKEGSFSRFKGVGKSGKKWQAHIWIPSEGENIKLGTFDSEEEAGVMHARARYKYPLQEPKLQTLDLSGVPRNLPPIPSDQEGSSSKFKGVTKKADKWQAQIRISAEAGHINLGFFKSEKQAGIMYARARYKYPAREEVPQTCPLDLRGVPSNIAPIPADKTGSSSRFKGVAWFKNKWQAKIQIPSKGGSRRLSLGCFDSEEEAGIAYARARYKYSSSK